MRYESAAGLATDEMLLITGTFRIPPDKVAAAQGIMRRMIEASRMEDGCVEYHYAQDVFDAGLIHVIERWADQQALDRHFASPHLAAWRAAWAEFGIGERNLRLCDHGEARPV